MVGGRRRPGIGSGTGGGKRGRNGWLTSRMGGTAWSAGVAGRAPRRQAGTYSALLPSRPAHQSVSTSGSCMSRNQRPSKALMGTSAARQHLQDIPPQVRSLDGQTVDPSGASWAFRSSIDGGQLLVLDWAALDKTVVLSATARHSVKLYFADRLARKKTRTVANDFGMFLRFQRWLTSQRQTLFDWRHLTEGVARGFLAHGMKTADKGNDFSRLRTFYEWCVARSMDGFDTSSLRMLQTITAVGNSKGHHVRFRDPVRGPFSPDELLLIRRALVAGQRTDFDRAEVMLHLELGHNALATIRLKNRELLPFETKTGVFYQLDVPRVKKRTAQRETKRRPISNQLGD